MHPDDVRAMLTGGALAPLRTTADRIALATLLDKYDKIVVLEALGGHDRTNKCPKCKAGFSFSKFNIFENSKMKALYSAPAGCHMVQCTSDECLAYFCWSCAEETRAIGHHACGGKKSCRLSMNDSAHVEFCEISTNRHDLQGFLPIRYLRAKRPWCLWIMWGFLYYPLLLVGPPYIAYRTVRYLLGGAWSWCGEQSTALKIFLKFVRF